ncbi:MAG: hypothetical protein M5U34_45180 [Chloroflexi bacterium]|nr:hypothetical protein [Chloroflexota bacterium]
MKVAQHPDSQQPVTASDTAPGKAICPHCGGVVILRRRKLMNNDGYTYFWRHQDNRNRSCNRRSHPV